MQRLELRKGHSPRKTKHGLVNIHVSSAAAPKQDRTTADASDEFVFPTCGPRRPSERLKGRTPRSSEGSVWESEPFRLSGLYLVMRTSGGQP
ncbi:hypothetical protein MHYP_G00302800 [Metynnis hypsauchen]